MVICRSFEPADPLGYFGNAILLHATIKMYEIQMVRKLPAAILVGVLVMMTHENAFPQEAGGQAKELHAVQFPSSSSPDAVNTDDPDVSRLTGKWRVASVEVDGEYGPAQIGQQVGDIISIGIKGNSFQFG